MPFIKLNTPILFPLQMMNGNLSILGCGWLGMAVARFLQSQNYSICGSTTSENKILILQQLGIEAFIINIQPSFQSNIASLRFWQSDVLFITLPPNPAEDYLAQMEQIAGYIQHTKQIKFVILASSVGVYGDGQMGVLDESIVPMPSRPTAHSCYDAEQFWREQTNVQTTILRFGGLVGGTRQAGRFLAGKTNVPNPQQVVNLVHLENCIQVVYQVLIQQQWGLTLNICADEHPTRRDFYTQQTRALGLEPPIFANQFLPVENQRIISNALAKKKLGYQFKYPNPMDFPME